jgi:hypothetical protein
MPMKYVKCHSDGVLPSYSWNQTRSHLQRQSLTAFLFPFTPDAMLYGTISVPRIAQSSYGATELAKGFDSPAGACMGHLRHHSLECEPGMPALSGTELPNM